MTNEMPVPTQSTNQVDPLAERYRAAFDKTERTRKQFEVARSEWIEATLELAAVVLEARSQFPNHNDFSRWIGRNGLQDMTQAERSALFGFARNPEAARKMLTKSTSYVWRTIWEKAPKGEQRAPSETGRGTISRKSHPSGHAGRQRAQRIPDVMQDKPRPLEVVRIKGLTREEVDPDFKGNAVEFAAKYGPVNLHTKAEIEHDKREAEVAKWAASVASAARLVDAMLPLPEAFSEWLAKPGKAAKLQAWQDVFRRAAERLQPVPVSDINSPEVVARMDADLERAIPKCPDRHSLND